ncbi:hypothetical protein ACFXOD_06400, partial [Streptomyces sp. NPDC059161]|uniref:hypothetical protein n=1 Tax=Streptomyces sp. NPDC059161 TaxID=3346749 RepID=UPI00367E3D79
GRRGAGHDSPAPRHGSFDPRPAPSAQLACHQRQHRAVRRPAFDRLDAGVRATTPRRPAMARSTHAPPRQLNSPATSAS